MSNDEEKLLARIIKGGLRSIAASVPILASFGQAWGEYEDFRAGNRIIELMENFQARLEELSSKCDNLEEISTRVRDEVPSLLEIVADKVCKEFSQEKRAVYADMLANLLLVQSDQPYDDKTTILHSIDTLNPVDLKVLKLFKSTDEVAIKNLSRSSLGLEGDDNHQLGELAGMLAKLESRGLIITVRLHGGVVYTPQGLDRATARLSETTYRILPLGTKLLSVLE